MIWRPFTLLTVVFLGSPPVWAENLTPEFRAAFEKTFRVGRAYAVMTRSGIPTTSVYGQDGNQTAAHFSIDIIDGEWKQSTGFLDIDQVVVDHLDLGEVLEIDSISYKDNRVDLRLVSVETHKVTRGEWIFADEKREPVATNFKFFLPFTESQILTPDDRPEVMAYIEQYFRVFPTATEAEAFASGKSTGSTDSSERAASPSRSEPISQEIEIDMTPLQVIDILGKPEKEIMFENRVRWTYPDLTVIFEDGKVKEVRF